MKAKKAVSLALAAFLTLPTLSVLGGCGNGGTTVLRVYNWEEYIDEGGSGTFLCDELEEFDTDGSYRAWYEETMGTPLSEEGSAILDDFCRWYENKYGQKIRVEYSTFGTNEDMYNEIVLGNEYDLLCPSDYMIMKLAAEDRLEKYDESFFDKADPENYYVRNVSPFIRDKFATNSGLELRNDDAGKPILWRDYAAGYMWGTTGFVYNPEAMDGTIGELLEERDWGIFTSPEVSGKITAKDNVRDTYFAALGVAYQNDLLSLDRGAEDYVERLTAVFNATDDKTISEVEPVLMDIKKNIYSFETDTGKSDMVNGTIWLNYAWSGDAVYALDLAESGETEDGDSETAMSLNYYVPKAGTNLWFDGWVMPKGANKKAAQAFVNFLSMPQNAMRNSYYIGYTSVISGENMEMLDYADYLYGEEEGAEDTVEYDLSYFFGEKTSIWADREQATSRQLYAQFPPEEVISRCAVMDYYDKEASKRINELWSRVRAETLDAWAIIVIVVTVLAIAAFVVVFKFGGRIDFFRRKPKAGYRLIRQEDPNRL